MGLENDSDIISE